MSRWRVAVAFWVLTAGLASVPAIAQDTPSPYGLPPPFKPKTEAPAPDTAKPDTAKPDSATTDIPPDEMPPEEDKSDAPKVFSFNPVQSKREVTAGDFYFKKGNYIAAVSRYDEATKWNDGNAEAWLRLGEAQEKRSNAKAAREAYQKFLELAPDDKSAPEIKRRLAKLKG
jgi:tetratricopeptide (TPR) repeat protein